MEVVLKQTKIGDAHHKPIATTVGLMSVAMHPKDKAYVTFIGLYSLPLAARCRRSWEGAPVYSLLLALNVMRMRCH